MDVAERLCRADEVCSGRGQRLTPLRRQVLALIAASEAPVGAYGILERLAVGGRVPAPPTIYRALDFLCANGLVHRVATRNAYVACSHPEDEHGCQLLLCSGCGRTVELELPELGCQIRQAAQRHDFRPERITLEVEGVCVGCRTDAATVAHA